MKKYVVLLLLVISVFVFTNFYGGDEPAPSTPVLRIGSECDYVPNSWEETTQTSFNVPIVNRQGYYADGYDVQIDKIVADELKLVLEVKKIEWNNLIPSLNKGDIDVIFSSMLDTEERKKSIAFSDTYEIRKTEYAILVECVSPYITATTLNDFKGAKIIGEKETLLDDVIVQIPGAIHLNPSPNIQGMIDAVLDGTADGCVIDTDTGHYYENMNKSLTLIKFKDGNGFKLGFSGVCAGVRKNDTELLHRINIALGNIQSSKRKTIMDGVTSRMMNVH